MKFNYSSIFITEYTKMKELDDFLELLSMKYPIEFEKDVYKNETFMALGIMANDIVYNPSPEIDIIVEREIHTKLCQLWNLRTKKI